MGSGTTNSNDLKKTEIVPVKDGDVYVVTFHCTFGDDSVKIIKNIDVARREQIITDGQYLTLVDLRERLKPEFEKLNKGATEPEGFTATIGYYPQVILSQNAIPLLLSSIAFGIISYIFFFQKQK